MGMIFDALMLFLGVVKFFIIAHFIMSWLISFQVLNLHQPAISQIWYGINRLLEPIYGPFRRIIPPMGGLDLAPMAAIILIIVLERALLRNQGMFYGY
ncbi:MAG: YggT family protein [Rhodobacteraceae bacterium]|nr:YggT family protein [Paracoccaceae bacterium]